VKEGESRAARSSRHALLVSAGFGLVVIAALIAFIISRHEEHSGSAPDYASLSKHERVEPLLRRLPQDAHDISYTLVLRQPSIDG